MQTQTHKPVFKDVAAAKALIAELEENRRQQQKHLNTLKYYLWLQEQGEHYANVRSVQDLAYQNRNNGQRNQIRIHFKDNNPPEGRIFTGAPDFVLSALGM